MVRIEKTWKQRWPEDRGGGGGGELPGGGAKESPGGCWRLIRFRAGSVAGGRGEDVLVTSTR